MTTLQEVLDRKDKIKALAEQFGFKNIRIYHDQDDANESLLQLVVEDQDLESDYAITSMQRKIYLKAKLSDLLNCQVRIINYDCVDDLYKDDIDIKSVSIDDESAMQKLLKDNVVYVGLGAKENRTHEKVLSRAKVYIEKYCSKIAEQDKEQSGAGYQSLMSSASHSEKEELARPPKKPRVEEGADSSGASLLIFSLPTPEDFQLKNMSSSEREAIAEQLKEHFYKCISKAPTFVK